MKRAMTAATALPWLVAIGFALLGLNWLAGPALYGSMWLGRPMRVLTRMLLDAIPAGGVMLALGSLAIVASPAAGLAYPIRDGIPIMLADEARQLDDA